MNFWDNAFIGTFSAMAMLFGISLVKGQYIWATMFGVIVIYGQWIMVQDYKKLAIMEKQEK